MAMEKDKLEKIIRDKIPGYRMLDRSELEHDSVSQVKADATSPDLEALRRKFLGAGRSAGPSSKFHNATKLRRRAAAIRSGEPNDEVVVVVPDNAAVDSRHHSKVVIISGKTGEIVGEQG